MEYANVYYTVVVYQNERISPLHLKNYRLWLDVMTHSRIVSYFWEFSGSGGLYSTRPRVENWPTLKWLKREKKTKFPNKIPI